ncbi:hypothetical protein BCR35DRAFT_299463 [Leucosporidium creatinivorum]|uniref:Succinate dehydrogenase assembly factor 4, mitochondrial n=1 Tax=Leucosporidium creatinivorum TaxID=106004 RepID=A0A1Y2G1U5_9BASI|nr:hypothetical protein BCR35DRAFT_299463 [Leucosporidium creatinivorum]
MTSLRMLSLRQLHTACRRTPATLRLSSSAPPKNDFSRPGPPPLSRAEQREFEELQRRVNAPASAPAPGTKLQQPEEEVMHPDYRRTPAPTFEGETNPSTGEVGGPKREPLVHGDWSYGGKCTDF